MDTEMVINLSITAACFFALGLYFNRRERKVHDLAERKLGEIRDLYIQQMARRRTKEKQEIERVKTLVTKLEDKHKKLMEIQRTQNQAHIDTGAAAEMIKKAEERAKQVEAEIKENAQKFLEEQQKEVQLKMVDLVIGVTKKVLAKGLSYNEHKQLIDEALAEVEGEELDAKHN